RRHGGRGATRGDRGRGPDSRTPPGRPEVRPRSAAPAGRVVRDALRAASPRGRAHRLDSHGARTPQPRSGRDPSVPGRVYRRVRRRKDHYLAHSASQSRRARQLSWPGQTRRGAALRGLRRRLLRRGALPPARGRRGGQRERLLDQPEGHPVRILILGVNGFIGNALTERILNSTGWTVAGLDIVGENMAPLLGHSRFIYLEGDISINKEWIEYQIKKCDVVLPLVAIANPSLYVKEPLAVFQLDFEENLRIVKQAVQYGKRVVFPSTSEVYGMCPDP